MNAVRDNASMLYPYLATPSLPSRCPTSEMPFISPNSSLTYSGMAASATLHSCNASACDYTLGAGEIAALVIVGVIVLFVILLLGRCRAQKRSHVPQRSADAAVGTLYLDRWVSEIGMHEFEVDTEPSQVLARSETLENYQLPVGYRRCQFKGCRNKRCRVRNEGRLL